MMSILSMMTVSLGASLVRGAVAAGGFYLAIGLVFALYFAWKGVERYDPVAEGAPWGFRLLVIPGAVALWPFLLPRTLRGRAA